MEKTPQYFDRDKAALIIRAAMAAKRIKQTEFVARIGMNRSIFNSFLNRRIDLLPEQIKLIFDELGLDTDRAIRLSSPAHIGPMRIEVSNHGD